MEALEILKIIICIISFFWINFDFITHRREFWKFIKGQDKILQPTEACIYVWVRIFPIVILADLFYDLSISKEAWYSLDAIFFGLILGDIGYSFKKSKDKDDKTKDNSTSSN